MRLVPSRERLALLTVAVGVLGCLAFAVVTGDWPNLESPRLLWEVAAFAGAIVVGEWLQLSAPGLRPSAPISTAAAFGLAFTVEMTQGARVPYAAGFVLAVTAVAMTLGVLARRLTGRPTGFVSTAGRLLAVVVATLLYRVAHLGQAPRSAASDDGLVPWQRALLLLAITVIALLADILFTSVAHAYPSIGSLRRVATEELRSSVALSTAVSVTGVLVALAAPALGIAALPLFLLPLVLTLFAFRRYVSIRATYLQSIRTLSRLTDAAGFTRSGHSERVAALSVAVGRALGLSERELLDLQYAALLHDIGQVALAEPIPGGATVLAAPADQRRIEADTVAIVRETGVLDDVARILEHQTTPYRRVRELGEQIPLPSRIIKVVNAYEDLTGGAAGRQARESALERVYLGLGYEYDPRVVDALTRVLGATGRGAAELSSPRFAPSGMAPGHRAGRSGRGPQAPRP